MTDLTSPSIMRENRELASELKFLVTPDVAVGIREWARHKLLPDPHGNGNAHDEYRITSLYFETDSFDVYNRKGSYARSKYRIRRYGAEDVVFLERKLKTNGLVAKRRSPTVTVEIKRLSEMQPDPGWLGSWYHRRVLLRGLKPICQISYERTARVASTSSGPVRLTLDENLRGIPAREYQFQPDGDCQKVAPANVVMEMKFRGETPTIFKELIEKFALSPKKMSKYRLAAIALGLVPENVVEFPVERNSVCLP
ncbi:MAG: polyphosphate polymerase domain-containing protein [Limisphaerales bacterium]